MIKPLLTPKTAAVLVCGDDDSPFFVCRNYAEAADLLRRISPPVFWGAYARGWHDLNTDGMRAIASNLLRMLAVWQHASDLNGAPMAAHAFRLAAPHDSDHGAMQPALLRALLAELPRCPGYTRKTQ